MNSLEKKLKCKAVNFNEMIKSYTRSWQQVKAVKENKKWVKLEDVKKEVGVVAKEIREISPKSYFKDYNEARNQNRNYVDGFLNGSNWTIQIVLGLLVENDPLRVTKEEKP